MRKLGWLGVLAAAMALSIYVGTPVSGQQQAASRPYGTPPPLVITAFGGKPVTYKAPRTPWGDPDLQGVWSSDDMEGVGIGVQQGGGRGGAGRGDGRGGGGPCAAEASAAALAGPPALYLTDEQLEARRKLVACQSGDRDRTSTSTFRNDYARRAFPQTRLLVDPPSGLMPTVLPGARIMPRGTNGVGPINSWLDFPLYERCITRGIGGSVLRVIYGNGNRIVQGPGVVAFSYEMLPDTRIFPIDGGPHVSDKISMYLGNSRARWDGEELVVETTESHRPDSVRHQWPRHSAQQGDENHRALPPRRRRHHSVPGDLGRSADLLDAIHCVVPVDAAQSATCCFRTTATRATRR